MLTGVNAEPYRMCTDNRCYLVDTGEMERKWAGLPRVTKKPKGGGEAKLFCISEAFWQHVSFLKDLKGWQV